MGNYRQHITFAWLLGACYSVGAYVLMGVHWFYGTVAALLTTLSGLLPDLDSSTGVGLRGFTGILGVVAAILVWEAVDHIQPRPIFEVHLWAMILAYILIRHGLHRVLSRLANHRGISHSLPTCGVWGLATYLAYPSTFHGLRVLMAVAVMVGFFSHLLLDEICSVDLRGARVNKAFGSAIKLWASSAWSTLGMYTLFSYLAWLTIKQWPDNPTSFDLPPVNVPVQEYARSLWNLVRSATKP